MRKVVIIGTSGHYEYALDAYKYDCDIVGLAKYHDSEVLDGCYNKLIELKYNVKIYNNYLEMLDIVKPDIAVINTIMNFNCYITIECLKRNIHVFSEKPLCSNLSELENLKCEYEKANLVKRTVLACMFGIEYESHFQTAKSIIEKGLLGEIRLIQAQKSYKLGNREWYYSNSDTYPGTIPWVSIHALDWIYGICKIKFDNVFSMQSRKFNQNNGDLEMTCVSTYKNMNEQLAVITSDYFRPKNAPTHDDDRMRVVGEKGILEISNKEVKLLGDLCDVSSYYSPKKSIFGDIINDIDGKSTCSVNFEYSYEISKVALISRNSALENEVKEII